MSLCICDGPPHPYDPSWCVGGLKPAGGERGYRPRGDATVDDSLVACYIQHHGPRSSQRNAIPHFHPVIRDNH